MYKMSFICVIGPCWNNLQTLLNTINNNKTLVPTIKKFYIPTNDINVHNYFCHLNDPTIVSYHFDENQGHQTSCYNAIISGMKMIIEHEYKDRNASQAGASEAGASASEAGASASGAGASASDAGASGAGDEDIVIFSHEDVYINDMRLFDNAISKFKNGYEVVCRLYTGTAKGEALDYYMNDAFFIKKNKVKEIFGNTEKKQIIIGNFCEKEFTTIIKNYKVFSIPYYLHSTHKDSELGFHHILNYNIGNIPFWDKSNMDMILSL